jgi:hypothetical protein
MVCGIIGFFCIPILLPIAAIVLGHMARSRIRRSAGTSAGGGMAIAGLVLGYLALVLQVLAIVFIVAVGNLSSDASVLACRTESDTLVTAANAAAADGGSSTPQDYLSGSLTYFELDGSRTTATLDQVSKFDCPAVDIGG